MSQELQEFEAIRSNSWYREQILWVVFL